MAYSLISGFQEEKNVGKKYQMFEAALGFESVKFLIPLSEADAFEKAAQQQRPKSVSSLKKIIDRFDGIIE